MNAVRDLNFDITAHDKTSRAFQSVKSNIGGMGKSLGGIKTLLAGAFGTAAIASLVRFSNEARRTADEIGKVSKTVGITAEALQEYRFAADIAGVSTETFDKGAQKFTRTIGELRAGTGALTTFLLKFDQGLAENLKSARSTDAALAIFFKRLEETSGAADRAALAAAAFGRAGVQMVNIVENGAGSIDQLRKKLRDMGGVISNEVIKDAEIMNDRFTTTERIIDTQLTVALLDLQGPLIELKQLFADIVGGIGEFLNRFKEVENLSLTGLEQRLKQLKAIQEENETGLLAFGAGDTPAEIARIEALIAAKEKLAATPSTPPGGDLGSGVAFDASSLFPEGTDRGLKAAQKAIDSLLIKEDAVQKARQRIAAAANKTRQDAIEALRLETAGNEQLTAALARGSEEYQKVRNNIDLQNEATRLNIDLTTLQGARWLQAARDAQEAAAGLETATAEREKAISTIREGVDTLGQTLSGAVDDVLFYGATWAEVARGIGQNIISGLISSLVEAGVQMAANFAISRTFGAATAAAAFAEGTAVASAWAPAAALASLATLGGNAAPAAAALASTTALAQGLALVPRAQGGPVTAGQGFLVGEKGPEAFFPGRSGTIFPNDETFSAGRAGDINITFQITANDTRGFDELLRQRRGLIVTLINSAVNERGRPALV